MPNYDSGGTESDLGGTDNSMGGGEESSGPEWNASTGDWGTPTEGRTLDEINQGLTTEADRWDSLGNDLFSTSDFDTTTGLVTYDKAYADRYLGYDTSKYYDKVFANFDDIGLQFDAMDSAYLSGQMFTSAGSVSYTIGSDGNTTSFNEVTNSLYINTSSLWGAYVTTTARIRGTNYSTRTRDFLGFSITTDQHYNLAGNELGWMDELVADGMEAMGIEISPATANAIQGFSNLVVGILMGAPAVSLLSGAVGFAADVAYATGSITKEEYTQVKAITMVVQLGITVVNTLQSLEAISSMSSYMTTTEKVLSYGITLGMAGIQIKAMTDALNRRGLDYGNLSMGDITARIDGDYSSASATFNAYASWKAVNTTVSTSIDTVQEDPYEMLAGGGKYNVQFAGGDMYLSDRQREPRNITNGKLGLGGADKVRLLQNDGHYKNLQPINTNVNTGLNQGYATAGELKLSRYSNLVNDYNEQVEAGNFDEAKIGELNILKAELESYWD